MFWPCGRGEVIATVAVGPRRPVHDAGLGALGPEGDGRHEVGPEVDRSALDQAVDAAATQAKSVRLNRLKPAALLQSWRRRKPEVGKAA